MSNNISNSITNGNKTNEIELNSIDKLHLEQRFNIEDVYLLAAINELDQNFDSIFDSILA